MSPQLATQPLESTSSTLLHPAPPTSLSPPTSPAHLSDAGRHSPMPQRVKFLKKFAAKPARSHMHARSAEQAKKDATSAAKKTEKEVTNKDMATTSEAANKRKAPKAVDGQKKGKAPKKVAAKIKPDKVDKKKDDMEGEALGASKKEGKTKRKGKPVAGTPAAKEAQKASKPQGKQQAAKPSVQSEKPEDQKVVGLLQQMVTEESREQEGMVRRNFNVDSHEKYPDGSVPVAEAVVKRAIVDAIPEGDQKVEHVTVDIEDHALSEPPPTSDSVLREVSKHAVQENEMNKKSKKKHKR